MLGPFFIWWHVDCFLFFVFDLVLALGSGVGTAPDLGNHFLLRQKVIKNRFSIPTVKLTSRCALRSDSHRESEFLWGSALRFARACLLRFWFVWVFLPAAWWAWVTVVVTLALPAFLVCVGFQWFVVGFDEQLFQCWAHWQVQWLVGWRDGLHEPLVVDRCGFA